MTGIERQRLRQTLLLGAALTLLVIAYDVVGLLSRLEYFLYDKRAEFCQFFSPPPTDQLVHVDIDDASLGAIGAWPWARTHWADIINELHTAGAKGISLDVIFAEPQLPRRAFDDNTPYPDIDDDGNFAQAVRNAGDVIIPLALRLKTERAVNPVTTALIDLLEKDVEMSVEDARVALTSALGPAAVPREGFVELYIGARRLAINHRIEREMGSGELPLDELARRLLPHQDLRVSNSLQRLLSDEYKHVLARRAVARFTWPDAQTHVGLIGREDVGPIPLLSSAAGASGFVDYLADADGKVRDAILLADYNGRIWPHASLTLACVHMGIPLDHVTFDHDELHLPGKAPVPLRNGSLWAIPWFGGRDWELMYNTDLSQPPQKHVPITIVWEVAARVRANNMVLDHSIAQIYNVIDPKVMRAYTDKPPPIDDPVVRLPRIQQMLVDDTVQLFEKEFAKPSPAGKPQEEEDARRFLDAIKTLRGAPAVCEQLAKDLVTSRAELRKRIGGCAVIVGFTATAAAQADRVVTSIHPSSAPGPVVNGVIFNGIVTGVNWWYAPRWVAWLLAALLGMLTSMAVGLLSPIRATLAAIGLALAWLAVNGLLLFDYGDRIVGAAAPLTAVVIPWAGCVMWRYLTERAERSRITKRFQSYVDPVLVNFILENPGSNAFAGEHREVSIVFTDLAGFTTLVERVGTGIVSLLSEYRAMAVPIIREQGGCISSFMGDGIMFFFGTPRPDPDHAFHAISTVMKLQEGQQRFNEALVAKGLEPLVTRAGITTGPVIAGDVGPPEASDYNVVGDDVNLAARLESANKAVGTVVMISENTANAVKDKVLLRPVGRLRVKGKTKGVMVFEPLAYIDQATEAQHAIADASWRLVNTYAAADFAACIAVADEMDQKFGAGKFTNFYRSACQHYLDDVHQHFDGTIVLTEK